MRAALFSHKFPLGSMHCNALAVSADQTRLMDKDLASSHQVARAVHQALLETSNFLKFSGACVLPALAPDRCKPSVFSQTKPWVKFSSARECVCAQPANIGGVINYLAACA